MSASESLGAPEPLAAHHELTHFDSGVATLDDWLRRRAFANHLSGASRVFVVCCGARVVGYCALATGGVTVTDAPGRIKRNMPDPVPVIVLGRLAIAKDEQGNGLGSALLKDALARIRRAAEEVGIAAVMVHALDERARDFYLRSGFTLSPANPLTLVARLADIEDALK